MNSWLKAGYEGFDTAGEVVQFYQQRDDDPADSDEAHADYNNDGLGEEIIAHRRCLRGEDNRHIRNADQRGMPVRSARRQLRESDPYQAFYMYSSDSADSGSDIDHHHQGGGRRGGRNITTAASAHSSKIVRQLREQRRVSERSKHTQWASMCPMPVGLASERLYLTRALHLPTTVTTAPAHSTAPRSSTTNTPTPTSHHRNVPSSGVGMGVQHGSDTTMAFEAPPPSSSSPVASPLVATPHHPTGSGTNPASSSSTTSSSYFASASFSRSGRAAMVAVPQTSANHASNRPLGGLAGHTATHVHLECAVPTGECDLLHTNTSRRDLAVLFGGVELEGLQKTHRDLQALDSREYGGGSGGGGMLDVMGVKRGRNATNNPAANKRLEKARIDAHAASSLVNGDFSVLELGVPESRQLFTQQKMRLATRTATTSILSVQGVTLKGRYGHCAVPFSFIEILGNFPPNPTTSATTFKVVGGVKAEVEEEGSVAVKVEPQYSTAYGTREDTVGVATTAVSVAETVPVEDVDDMAYTNDDLHHHDYAGNNTNSVLRDTTVEVKSEPTSTAPFVSSQHHHHHHFHQQLPPTSRNFHPLPDNRSNSNSATTVLNEGDDVRTRSPSLHGHLHTASGGDCSGANTNDSDDRTVLRISPRQMPPTWASPSQPLRTKSNLLIIGGCTSVDMVHARRVRRLYGNSIGTFKSDFEAWSGDGTSKGTPTQLNLMQYVKRSAVVFEPWLCSVEAHRIPHGPDAIQPRRGVASSSQIETRIVCQPFTSIINAPSGRCFATCVELPTLPTTTTPAANNVIDLTTPPFSRFLLFGGTADGLFPVGWDAEKVAIGQQARSDRRSRRIRARRVRQELAERAMREQQQHDDNDDDEGGGAYRRGGNNNSSSAFAESDMSSLSSVGDSEDDDERRVRHNNRNYQPSEDEAHTSNLSSGDDYEEYRTSAQRRSGTRVERDTTTTATHTTTPANDDDTPLISLPNESNSDACVLLMLDPAERVMLCDSDIVRREHNRLQHLHSQHQASSSSSLSPSSTSRMKVGGGSSTTPSTAAATSLHHPPAQLRLLRPNQSFITGGPCPRFGHSCTSMPTKPGMLLLYGGVGGRPSTVDDRLHSGRSSSRRDHMRLLGRGKESRLPSLLSDLWEFSSVTYSWREINLWHASPAPTSLPLRAFHVCTVVLDPSLLTPTAPCGGEDDAPPTPFLFISGGKLQNNYHDRAVRASSSSASSGSGRSGLVPSSTATDDPMTSIFATVAAASIVVNLSTGAWRPVSTPAFNEHNPLSKAGQGNTVTTASQKSSSSNMVSSVVAPPTALVQDHLRDTISLTLSRFYASLHLKQLADIQHQHQLHQRGNVTTTIRTNSRSARLSSSAVAVVGSSVTGTATGRRVQFFEEDDSNDITAVDINISGSGYRRANNTPLGEGAVPPVVPSPSPASLQMGALSTAAAGGGGGNDEDGNDFCLPSSSDDERTSDVPDVQPPPPTDPHVGAPRSESPDMDLDLLSCLLDTDVAENINSKKSAALTAAPKIPPHHHQSVPDDLQSKLSMFASSAGTSSIVADNEVARQTVMQLPATPATTHQAEDDDAVPSATVAGPSLPPCPSATALGALLPLSGCPFIHTAHGAYSAGLVVALPPPNTTSDFWCGRRVPHVVLFGGEGAVNTSHISEFVFPQLAPTTPSQTLSLSSSSVPRRDFPTTTSTLSAPSLTLRSSAALFLAQSASLLSNNASKTPASSKAPMSDHRILWAPQERDHHDSVACYESGTTRFAVAKSIVKEPPQFSLPL